MGILTEYGWFWLSSLTCFVCYGHIVIRWWQEADGDSELIRQAVVMVWYPIGAWSPRAFTQALCNVQVDSCWMFKAYFVEIFPQSVVRLLQMDRALNGKPAPPNGWTIFTTVIFASSGWVNVFLWVTTGRQFGFTTVRVQTTSDDGANSDGMALARGEYGLKPLGESYRPENQRHSAFPP